MPQPLRSLLHALPVHFRGTPRVREAPVADSIHVRFSSRGKAASRFRVSLVSPTNAWKITTFRGKRPAALPSTAPPHCCFRAGFNAGHNPSSACVLTPCPRTPDSAS